MQVQAVPYFRSGVILRFPVARQLDRQELSGSTPTSSLLLWRSEGA
jgi:hypothetical protein